MSGLYTSEPPTSGNVIIYTTYGNIDIELWTKEAPRTCRNFIQLCLEGFYNDSVFHRIIKEFMIQAGDPKGNGGESIYKTEFEDEFHSRLRFNHRGIVAMANKNLPNTNRSQFFITMNKCPWLEKKHTIFGKVAGQTYFNAHAISELPTQDDFPTCDLIPKIIKTEVVINPFTDIIVKNVSNKVDIEVKKDIPFKPKQVSSKLVNSNLISFDDDLEIQGKQEISKIIPIHQVLKGDKKLINKPVINLEESLHDDIEIKTIPQTKNNFDNVINYSEESEEDDIEDQEIIKKNKILNDKTTKYEEMKKQIQDIKKRSQQVEKQVTQEEEENKLTPLQKIQKEFLQNKRSRVSTQDKVNMISIFKEKLKSSDKDDWMNNKLKFHTDSQKAYNLNDLKEKQQKNYDLTLNK